MNKNPNIVLFALTASKALGEKVAKTLKMPLSEMQVSRFADGEILVKPSISVRNCEVYIIQSTSPPVNEHLMELLIALDALKRGSAKSINIIVPYYGYARQDRKSKGREPITSKLVANLITAAGADRMITMDLHSPQSMGFFDIPVDDLRPIDEISEWIFNYCKKNNLLNEKIAIVSPDHGGLVRVKKITDKLQLIKPYLAVIDKSRTEANVSKIDYILGNVKDKVCFIIDDMIDTANTICNAAKALKERGSKEVILLATHAVFSDPACANINELIKQKIIEKVVVTDTICLPENKKITNLEIISISNFLAEVITTVVNHNSISDLYSSRNSKLISKMVRK